MDKTHFGGHQIIQTKCPSMAPRFPLLTWHYKVKKCQLSKANSFLENGNFAFFYLFLSRKTVPLTWTMSGTSLPWRLQPHLGDYELGCRANSLY